jgi:septation ring formation regulator EzrA
MVTVIAVVVVAVSAFVTGVLVGRRNRQKVEASVAEVNKLASEVKAKL